ncbi:ASAH1-like protein [Mya arenaria]|uniref:ceramidase n=1 Tax=Mya arenaria TaxID=6604 RepID=A0ABY7DNK5_MYAAR|nr:ASAH1-like protein [Mya arenaria]
MDIPVVFTLSSLYILAILCCCSQGQSPPYEAECVEGKYPPPSSRRVKEYVVNLDLPGEVTLYNIFYEIFTVCTSIVAQDSNGTLYHARNLDFGLFMGWDPKNRTWEITELLRPAIVNLDFQRGGKTVFKSVNYAGYVGILTAISPGKFTLTMNERFTLDGGYIGIINLILTGKGTWMGFLTRATMEKAESFKEARAMLTSTQMIAPAYFILAGNTSGQLTTYTALMQVNQGHLETWLQYCPDPCFPCLPSA